jgi:hypothetical protein
MLVVSRVVEAVRAVFKGIDGFVLRANLMDTCPDLAEEAALESAVQHLAAGVPRNMLGESYLERVSAADPEVLERALRKNGLNGDHVKHWGKHYAKH